MSVFDERANEWDTPDRIERARGVAAAIRERLPLAASTRAIDIGTGTGLLGLELAPDVGSMVLADPSEGMIAVARDKLAGVPNATAIVYDLPAEPPPGAPFDLALSLLMLHHIEDTEAVLRSIRAMLAPGGSLALADLEAEDGSFHGDPHGETIHHHGFDQRKLRRLTADVGFSHVRSEDVWSIERDGQEYPLFLLTATRS